MKTSDLEYQVYYGPTVPFQNETFTKWSDVCTFMKRQLDAGVPIHSVHKENKDEQSNSGCCPDCGT